jgi:hypothetical protein
LPSRPPVAVASVSYKIFSGFIIFCSPRVT